MPPKPSAAKPTYKAAHHQTSRKKISVKKPLSQQEKLRRLFKSLCAQIDGGHFKNALKTCDKILRMEPKDADALQTKLFLLLQTEQYDAALAQLTLTSGVDSHGFEKAYALYRRQRETEAFEVLSSLKKKQASNSEGHRGVLHLEAQLNYRQGSYQTAFDVYTQLLDTSAVQSEEHADLLTNLNAAQTHLDFLTTGYLHALDALPASVTNALETTPPPVPPSTTSAVLTNTVVASSAPIKSTAGPDTTTKKVRMSRVPQGVVPGVTPPPDPERWLKKSERTNFGQGAKRRKAAGGGATQGSLAETTTASHATKSSGGKHKKKK